jgi:hypothetical protein
MRPYVVFRGTDESEEAAEEVLIDLVDLPPLLPEAQYLAKMTHHETAIVFRVPKVFLRFEIVDPGEHFGAKLFGAYRVKELAGKPGRNGRFKVRKGSDLLLMLSRVLDLKPRPDRISLCDLRGCVLRVQVKTVTRDYRQRALPSSLQYSKVADVIGKETG